MTEILFDSKHGVYFRPGTYDLDVAKEVSSYRHLKPKDGGTLLDVGGNIGCVSRWWLKNGGDRSIAVEPEPSNLTVLKKNLSCFNSRALIIPKAAVADGSPEKVKFYINKGINKGAHTLRPTRGRQEVVVSTVPFSQLLSLFKPDALKMDIEGGEYALKEQLLDLPPCVKRFAIEWHLTAGKTARSDAIYLDDQLKARGWQCVYGNGANMNSRTWHVTRVYSR